MVGIGVESYRPKHAPSVFKVKVYQVSLIFGNFLWSQIYFAFLGLPGKGPVAKKNKIFRAGTYVQIWLVLLDFYKKKFELKDKVFNFKERRSREQEKEETKEMKQLVL